ncbi:hypothetical protein QBC46DRAFT_274260, partial [Diplogelasinospora grovesii]
VIVWPGEAENDGDRALEEIHLAADEMATGHSITKSAQQAILALLQRPWFKRIWLFWVPQEVAAARNILIECGSTEIDGYPFCVGLNSKSFNFLSETPIYLQSLIRSVNYLIRGY